MTKSYVVRAGFILAVAAKNMRGETITKTYNEGDTLQLDPEVDIIPHQVELADEADRAAAAKAEAKQRKAAEVSPAGTGINSEALAAAIADGVARALAAMAPATGKPSQD